MAENAEQAQNKFKIFISYSRHDANVTLALADGLREDGYTVWTDVNGIPGGAVWLYEIEAAITSCDVVIVMISRGAKASEWVRREILFALDLKKLIIPVRLEDIALPFALIDLQPVDHYPAPLRTPHYLRNALKEVSRKNTPQTSISEKTNEIIYSSTDGISLVDFKRYLINSSY